MKNNLANLYTGPLTYAANPGAAAVGTPPPALTDEIENSIVTLRDRLMAVAGELERIGDTMWGSQPQLAGDAQGNRAPSAGRADLIRDRFSELFRVVDLCENQTKRFSSLAG